MAERDERQQLRPPGAAEHTVHVVVDGEHRRPTDDQRLAVERDVAHRIAEFIVQTFVHFGVVGFSLVFCFLFFARFVVCVLAMCVVMGTAGARVLATIAPLAAAVPLVHCSVTVISNSLTLLS